MLASPTTSLARARWGSLDSARLLVYRDFSARPTLRSSGHTADRGARTVGWVERDAASNNVACECSASPTTSLARARWGSLDSAWLLVYRDFSARPTLRSWCHAHLKVALFPTPPPLAPPPASTIR